HWVRVLNRDGNVAISGFFKEPGFRDCGVNQSRRASFAALSQNSLIQRATVDTDATGDSGVASSLSNFLHATIDVAHTAGLNTHGGTACIDSCEDVLRLEVNISNNRNWGLLRDGWQCLGINSLRASDTHNVATCGCELRNLLQG